MLLVFVFFFKQKTAYEMRISDWSSDVCSSDLLGEAWNGARPAAFGAAEGWRTKGDTVERLELLAAALVADECKADAGWTRTAAVLEKIATEVRPAVAACDAAEIAGLLRGLDGRDRKSVV